MAERPPLMVAVGLALLFGTYASASAQPPTRDDLCEPDAIWRVPAPENGEVVLPVTVHYMKSTAHRHDVSTVLTPQTIRRYFRRSGTINSIWMPGGVRLFLHRIERCRYDPVTMTGQIPGQPEEVPDPISSAPQMFDRVVRFYNYQATRGLDLYLWWEIAGTLVGYALPYELSDGSRRTGAVWIDTQCVRTSQMARKCARLMAHEIGHFLGLCHRCRVAGDPATGCTACSGPQSQIPVCASSDRPKLLMRSRYDGTALDSTCEIPRATGQARDRISGSSP